jgi:hypothetical protein
LPRTVYFKINALDETSLRSNSVNFIGSLVLSRKEPPQIYINEATNTSDKKIKINL